MEDLKQIKTVLLGLGIQVNSIELTTSPTGSIDTVSQVRTVEDLVDSITVFLTFQGHLIKKTYTIEQLRSGLVTGSGKDTAARQEPNRKPSGLPGPTS